MSLILLVINIFLFNLYLNFLNKKINIKKIYFDYIDSIRNLKIKQKEADLLSSFDKLTVKGSKLFIVIILYLIPCVPSFYFLNYLKFPPFISILIISLCYLFLLIKYKNE